MSFSKAVKNDLVRINPSRDCCQLAEFAAFLKISGSIQIGSRQSISFSIITEHPGATRRMFVFIRKLFGLEAQILVHRKARLNKSQVFDIRIPPQKGTEKVLALLGLKDPGQAAYMDFPGKIKEDMLLKPCCKRAYLRGAFLAGGSINNPEGNYHLEIVCNDKEHCRLIREILADFGIEAKTTQRKQMFVVYLKGSEAIADTLNIMGSHRSLLEFENIRIVKEIRNRVNRQTNCENANINKTVNSGLSQVEDIKLIDEHIGLDRLPSTLRQAAQARLSNPGGTLAELAENLGLGRSGMNHRLRRLRELASDIRGDKKI